MTSPQTQEATPEIGSQAGLDLEKMLAAEQRRRGGIWRLLGNGFWILLVTIVGAILGTFTYGVVRNKLPH